MVKVAFKKRVLACFCLLSYRKYLWTFLLLPQNNLSLISLCAISINRLQHQVPTVVPCAHDIPSATSGPPLASHTSAPFHLPCNAYLVSFGFGLFLYLHCDWYSHCAVLFLSLVVICVVYPIFVMVLVDWDNDSPIRLRENQIKCLAFNGNLVTVSKLFWPRTELPFN